MYKLPLPHMVTRLKKWPQHRSVSYLTNQKRWSHGHVTRPNLLIKLVPEWASFCWRIWKMIYQQVCRLLSLVYYLFLLNKTVGLVWRVPACFHCRIYRGNTESFIFYRTKLMNFKLFLPGTTPQRRPFDYPTKLIRTDPHDVLRARFQASYVAPPYSPEPQPIKV